MFFSIFAFNTVLYWLCYRYLTPRSSASAYLYDVSVLEAIGFGAVMTLFSSAVGGLVVVGLTLTVVPVATYFLAMVQLSTAFAWSCMALAAICIVFTLQVANWLGSMITSRLMPRTLHIATSHDGFRAAWAPTIIQSLVYGAFFLSALGLMLFGQTNVH